MYHEVKASNIKHLNYSFKVLTNIYILLTQIPVIYKGAMTMVRSNYQSNHVPGMALLLKEGERWYKYIIHDLADPYTQHLPLIKSPIPIAAFLAIYFLFVYKWGPEHMKNRKPYNLKKTLIIYNAFQMLYSLFLAVWAATSLPLNEWKCSTVRHSTWESERLIQAGYGYFILKIIDLMDTVFFTLKKNYRQVTFLHVYHHSLMVVLAWGGIKYSPGGQSSYLPYINTLVHVVMYGYYLLSVYDETYKKSLWWKKHITELQLFQFGLLIIFYGLPLIYDCGYPKGYSILILVMNTTMITLFLNFYYKTYIEKNK